LLLLAMIGGFACLHISKIPFLGPAGSVRVGMIDGQPILFPTDEERKKGQAWGLKTIESFHTHGTPPV
jgi:polyribonucleotide nucleotidyltransferase